MSKIIQGESAQVDDSYKTPKQSANCLFHFMKDLDYLIDILQNKALIPRYCEEDVSYLAIGLKTVAYPMKCFCDINLHKLPAHLDKYGFYGIAFSKTWCIDKGIQPIQYLNRKSSLRDDFTQAFNSAIENAKPDVAAYNYLLSQMFYFKPIQGLVLQNNLEENFTDEQEWRYIPDVTSLELQQVLRGQFLSQQDICNKALAYAKSCWLQFDFDDIKYIIIKNDDDFNRIIEVIEPLPTAIKNKLISKIIIWDDSKGDF